MEFMMKTQFVLVTSSVQAIWTKFNIYGWSKMLSAGALNFMKIAMWSTAQDLDPSWLNLVRVFTKNTWNQWTFLIRDRIFTKNTWNHWTFFKQDKIFTQSTWNQWTFWRIRRKRRRSSYHCRTNYKQTFLFGSKVVEPKQDIYQQYMKSQNIFDTR